MKNPLLMCLNLLLLCALVVIAPNVAADDDDDEDDDDDDFVEFAFHERPIVLEVSSPAPPRVRRNGTFKSSHMTETRSGWPLTFKLVAELEDDQGIAVGREGINFPITGTRSWLVLEGADDCFVDVGGQIFNLYFPCREFNDENAAFPEPIVLDNIVEFTPDEDFPGVPDAHGNPNQQSVLQATSDNPQFGHGPDVDGGKTLEFGVVDGIGYGANDDLPGFVLLSNVGVGLALAPALAGVHPVESFSNVEHVLPPSPFPPADVCDPDCTGLEIPFNSRSWVPAEPIQARNLAGLMTSTAYELDDQRHRTTITTSMVVPMYLFAPTILTDLNLDTSVPTLGDGCPARQTMRVDGGPLECTSGNFTQLGTEFQLRAFLVKGTAPTIWSDCDGDGIPSADDAECNFQYGPDGSARPYTVLSNEIVLTVNQLEPVPIPGGNIVCFDQDDPWGTDSMANVTLVDFEGNDPETEAKCPGGSGKIRRF